MHKYEPLHRRLSGEAAPRLSLTFQQIEHLLGVQLPHSAYQYSAWWANEANGRHVQAWAWRDAGYRAEADLEQRRVTFARISPIVEPQ